MAFKDTPDPRHSLPNRRLTETLKITTPDGQNIHLLIGYDPDDDTPRKLCPAWTDCVLGFDPRGRHMVAVHHSNRMIRAIDTDHARHGASR